MYCIFPLQDKARRRTFVNNVLHLKAGNFLTRYGMTVYYDVKWHDLHNWKGWWKWIKQLRTRYVRDRYVLSETRLNAVLASELIHLNCTKARRRIKKCYWHNEAKSRRRLSFFLSLWTVKQKKKSFANIRHSRFRRQKNSQLQFMWVHK